MKLRAASWNFREPAWLLKVFAKRQVPEQGSDALGLCSERPGPAPRRYLNAIRSLLPTAPRGEGRSPVRCRPQSSQQGNPG